MKQSLFIAAILVSQIICGQNTSAYTAGQLIEISGQVLDAKTQDTLVFAKLELLASNIVIEESIADFDGNYSLRFCSNKVKSDSLILQVQELGYLSQRMELQIRTELFLTVYLEEDSMFQSTDNARQQYLASLHQDQPTSCGTAQYECDYEANAMHRHCDGRIESFRRLRELNEKMGEWEKL